MASSKLIAPGRGGYKEGLFMPGALAMISASTLGAVPSLVDFYFRSDALKRTGLEVLLPLWKRITYGTASAGLVGGGVLGLLVLGNIIFNHSHQTQLGVHLAGHEFKRSFKSYITRGFMGSLTAGILSSVATRAGLGIRAGAVLILVPSVLLGGFAYYFAHQEIFYDPYLR